MKIQDLDSRFFFPLLFLRMFDEKIPMPQNDRIWHLFFYQIKNSGREIPEWISNMFFNADSYPKANYLNEVLWSLRTNRWILVKTPEFKDCLDPNMIQHWRVEYESLVTMSEELMDFSLTILKELLKKYPTAC